jgi:hypothetical protein
MLLIDIKLLGAVTRAVKYTCCELHHLQLISFRTSKLYCAAIIWLVALLDCLAQAALPRLCRWLRWRLTCNSCEGG